MSFVFEDIGNLSYIKRVTLDLSSGPSHLQLFAKQNDENSRYIEVTITRNGEVFTIPASAIARLRAKKPNGKIVYAECAIHNNKVYADLSKVINTAGSAIADVELTVVGQILSTQIFVISTCKAPFEDSDVEDSDDFSAFKEALLRLAYLDENGVVVIPDGYITTEKIAEKAVDTNNLATASVTAGKLADRAVHTGHILDGAVTTEKIAESAVDPGALDRTYTEYFRPASISSFSELNTYLTDAEDLTIDQTIYRLTFDRTFPEYGLVGDSMYIGFVGERSKEDSTPTLVLINVNTFEKWSYVRNSGVITKNSSFIENGGESGSDGISPVLSVSQIEGGHRITVTDVNGDKTFDVLDGKNGVDGKTPVKGTDYWTDTDKQEINSFVIEEVANHLDGAKSDIVAELITQIGGMPVFGTVDDNNVITVTSMLADGIYTLKYENSDGTIADIGKITVGEGEPDKTSYDVDVATIGYTDGFRWSTTDGTIRDNATGYTAINKIPFERASGQTMIINLSGITWTDDALATQYAYILMFVDDSFTSGHNMPLKGLPKNYDNIGVSGALNDDGTITITVKDGTNGLFYNGFKLCGVGSGANAKITITIE